MKENNHPSLWLISLTMAALLSLALASALLAGHAPGNWGLAIALGIAIIKILLVASIFMNLRRAPPLYVLALLILILTSAALIGLVASNVAMRPSENRWYHNPPQKQYPTCRTSNVP